MATGIDMSGNRSSRLVGATVKSHEHSKEVGGESGQHGSHRSHVVSEVEMAWPDREDRQHQVVLVMIMIVAFLDRPQLGENSAARRRHKHLFMKFGTT